MSEEIKEYVYTNETGDAQIIVYRLFPGVEVAYVSVHGMEFDFGMIEKESHKNCVSIRFCREGRIEQEIGREFFYLMPGDCSIVLQDKGSKTFQLPLKHYHGIHIGIDFDVSANFLFAFLEKSGIVPLDVVKNLSGGNSYAIFRSIEWIKKFFSEFYQEDSVQCLEYLRIKLPEFFYRMKYMESDNYSYDKTLVPYTQVELVKHVADYISQNINEKITIQKLTLEFGVSVTHLQNAFRSVYGMPVISFIRMQKMQSAAQVLIHTTHTIEEIAEEFGYENESKFSAAFKKIMGDSPSVYRREHSKIRII